MTFYIMARFSNILKKTNINFQSCLNSKFLLYFVLILAATDLYIFAVNGELTFVALFVIIGFLTTFFSKNMTVILFVSIILTNILRFGKDVGIKEGMADGDELEKPEIKEAVDGEAKVVEKGGDDEYLGSESKAKSKKDLDTVEKDTTEPKPEAKILKADSDVTPKDIASKIEGLDQDTAQLLQKQKKLLENMENLNPLLQRAEQFLEKFKNVH